MPRFAILRHETAGGVHFDFMLESAGVLKTWALPQAPQPGLEMPCEALPDHRLAYLDYEGPISGGRGGVTRWSHGVFSIERQSDDEWVVKLNGDNLAGKAVLRRSADDPTRWVFSLTASATTNSSFSA
jgi:hypothetical protein